MSHVFGMVFSRRIPRSAVGVLLFFAVSCAREHQPSRPSHPGTVLARVNGAPLTSEAFLDELPEDLQERLTAEEKAEFIERWIDRELLYQAALAESLDLDPVHARRMERIEKEYLGEQVLQKILEDQTRVSEEELRRYYKEHEVEYQKEVRVRHILVHTREEAEEIRDELVRRVTSFTVMAKRRSVDPIAGKGGDLGYLSKGNMIPAFEDVVFDLDRGEISDVVKSDLGYHLIQLVDVRDARVKIDYDDVRTQILNRLLLEKRNEAYAALMDSLRSAARISIDLEPLRPDPADRRSSPETAETASRN
jgi:parvulin-like peptidyl-prolyl isomerase